MDTTGLLSPQIPHSIAIRQSLDVNDIVWDGSPTGTGKTYSAAAVLRDMGKKFCVVCPKLAIPQWKTVLEKFGLKAEFILNYEKLCRGNTKWLKYRRKQKDVPWFMLIYLKIPKDWVIVLDESHKCKGVESLQAGLMMAVKRQGNKAIYMSATQATNPMDMRAFGQSMGLHNGEMKPFKDFCIEAGAEWKGKWGAQFFDSEKAESVAKLAKVHDTLFDFKKVGFRMNRADFGDIFPDVQTDVQAYDMGTNSDKIQSVYDEMEYELDKLADQCDNYANHALAIIMAARRKAEMLKVPAMLEMGVDLHQEGKSVIYFVNFTDTIVALYERLCKEFDPATIGKLYGEQTYTSKLADMQAFNEDKKRWMVANQAAGGQSINLHDLIGNYPRASVINPSYSAINIVQCAGRTDRAYALTDVYLRFLFAARTIEEHVCQRLQAKRDFINILNDGMLAPNERIFKFARGMAI